MTVCDVPGTALLRGALGTAPGADRDAVTVRGKRLLRAPGGGLPAVPARMGFTIAADGSYAACLVRGGTGGWLAERWTLGGPEPYTVRLPGHAPERPGSALLALPDGRVLICRRAAPGFRCVLLSPTGPGTAELPVGELPLDEVRLLPPPPGAGAAGWGGPALALAAGCSRGGHGTVVTSVWLLVAGREPQQLADLPGRYLGGTRLDREGRMLALDGAFRGRVKTVVLDLDTGRTSPLLQFAPRSNDRLLLADPDSGLLVVRSDAPGGDRLGWGVLGSELPVRFSDCLRPVGGAAAVTPFAVQPGAALTPEECGVALWAGGPDGARPVVWRPGARTVEPLTAPPGWLAGAGHWSAEGLRLPFATPDCPSGLATLRPAPAGGARAAGEVGEGVEEGAAAAGGVGAEREEGDGRARRDGAERDERERGGQEWGGQVRWDGRARDLRPDDPAAGRPAGDGAARSAAAPPLRRPVPLQHAPLAGGPSPCPGRAAG